jgi:methyltransferase
VVSRVAFSVFIGALVLERAYELSLSQRNAARAKQAGALEYGARHLRWMKALHSGFFVAALLEVWLLPRPFVLALALPCLLLALLAQALRYWAIATLGSRWNIAVIVLPGVPAEASGPFRYVRHPNYVAVVIEGFAVPLLHGAYLTAGIFSVLNALLLGVRIRCEEQALAEHCGYRERLGSRPRFWPARSSGP